MGETLLLLSLVLLLGIGFGKLAKLFKLPSVTGYLVAGIIFGPFALGGISIGSMPLGFNDAFISATKGISMIAFSFICFSLGEEVKLKKLRQIGSKAVFIAFTQAIAAFILVGGALCIVAAITNEKYISYSVALVLGALATASAPTAKFMITRQYKTGGEITDMMGPIVAFDDIIGIIIFAIVLCVVPVLEGGKISMYSLVLSPMFEIFVSLAIGVSLGVLLGYITKHYRIKGAKIVICIGFMLLLVGLYYVFEDAHWYLKKSTHEGHLALSPLLMAIAMGTMFSFVNHDHGLQKRLDSWTYPMFVAFFVLAGASLDLLVFTRPTVLLIGLVYLVFRFLGKYFGTRYSCKLVHLSDNICRYLGITLLPQADVALGMAFVAARVLSEYGDGGQILNVIFMAAIVCEIIGHIWIRIALKRAGEIHGDIDQEKKPLKLKLKSGNRLTK